MKAEGDLIAKGQLLLQGKTSHVWRFDMYDESHRLISQVTVTCAIVPKIDKKKTSFVVRYVCRGR